MADAASPVTTRCLELSPRALHTLRTGLERDHGYQAAVYLQQAGFAAGADAFAAFEDWLQRHHRLPGAADLDAAYFGEAVSSFFGETGWGRLASTQLSDAVLALDSKDWAEADPEGNQQYPSCHLSSGLLADFMGRLSGDTVAVMEVECRSRGDHHCRFLVGAPETLAAVYERMSEGVGYLDATQGADNS